MKSDPGTGVADPDVLVRLAAASPSPCAVQALVRHLADTRTVFLSTVGGWFADGFHFDFDAPARWLFRTSPLPAPQSALVAFPHLFGIPATSAVSMLCAADEARTKRTSTRTTVDWSNAEDEDVPSRLGRDTGGERVVQHAHNACRVFKRCAFSPLPSLRLRTPSAATGSSAPRAYPRVAPCRAQLELVPRTLPRHGWRARAVGPPCVCGHHGVSVMLCSWSPWPVHGPPSPLHP
jgi:hypothetical protein